MASDSVFLSTVTLNSRNGVSPALKDDDCKTPRLLDSKIPEGDLLLQVSLESVV